jgi:hypothetical protein
MPERVIASEKVPQDENGEAPSWLGAVNGSQDAWNVLRVFALEGSVISVGNVFENDI